MVYVLSKDGTFLFASEVSEGYLYHTEIAPPFDSYSPKFYDYVFNSFTQKWSAKYNFDRQQKHLALQRKKEEREREKEIEDYQKIEKIIVEGMLAERLEMLEYSQQKEVDGVIIPLKKTKKKSV